MSLPAYRLSDETARGSRVAIEASDDVHINEMGVVRVGDLVGHQVEATLLGSVDREGEESAALVFSRDEDALGAHGQPLSAAGMEEPPATNDQVRNPFLAPDIAAAASGSVLVEGSSTVWVNGRPACRTDDPIADGDAAGPGSETVFIGG